MIEVLIKYVLAKANDCYADDFPIYRIEDWIREFFSGYKIYDHVEKWPEK